MGTVPLLAQDIILLYFIEFEFWKCAFFINPFKTTGITGDTAAHVYFKLP